MVRRSEANPWLHSVIRTTIKSDIDKAIRRLDKIQRKQLPFAASVGINNTANRIKEAERTEMKRVFDRPKPFTLNSLYVERATKRNPSAKVGIKDRGTRGNTANTYLQAQIHTRSRRLKGVEKLLNARGILPDGYYIVPGKGAKLDMFGNIPRKVINPLLKPNSKNLIVLPERDGKAGGVFKIHNKVSLIPLLIFVRQPDYDQRFNFYQVANTTYRKHVVNDFNRALTLALRTAR